MVTINPTIFKTVLGKLPPGRLSPQPPRKIVTNPNPNPNPNPNSGGTFWVAIFQGEGQFQGRGTIFRAPFKTDFC